MCYLFFSFGCNIGKRPWLTIILSVSLCLVCSAGNAFWQVNTDTHALWTPYGSPVSLIKAHFLYRILDSKKTSRFQISVPDLWEIHRKLKQQKKINSHDGFFRKSPFCTFSCINLRFGGPLVMIRKNFLLPFSWCFKRILLAKKNLKFHM